MVELTYIIPTRCKHPVRHELGACRKFPLMDLHCGNVFLSMKFFLRTPFRHPTTTFLVGVGSLSLR